MQVWTQTAHLNHSTLKEKLKTNKLLNACVKCIGSRAGTLDTRNRTAQNWNWRFSPVPCIKLSVSSWNQIEHYHWFGFDHQLWNTLSFSLYSNFLSLFPLTYPHHSFFFISSLFFHPPAVLLFFLISFCSSLLLQLTPDMAFSNPPTVTSNPDGVLSSQHGGGFGWVLKSQRI